MKKLHTGSDSFKYRRKTIDRKYIEIEITWGRTTLLIFFLIILSERLVESKEILLFFRNFLSWTNGSI